MIRELTTHLWQSTFFAIAVGLLSIAFRKNRAQVRYWLWLSASLKFFVPFALLIGVGGHLGWAPAAQKIATPAISFAVEVVAQPFDDTLTFAPVKAPRDWTPIVTGLIVGLWAIGFLVIALIRLRLWLRVRTALRASAALDIPAPVAIRSAPGLLEPGVVGLWRPVLLLPDGIVDRLRPSELEAVLAHELCHVRRRDNLFASIHMVAEAVFWFHPLVWWIGARMLEERERACDEGVLSLGNQPRVYADAILNVCKLYVESPLVCVSGVTGSDIGKRIEAIMMNRTVPGLNSAKKILLAMAAMMALAGPVAVGVLIAVGHVPTIHAQSRASVPPLVQTGTPPVQIAQALPEPQRAPEIATPQAAASPLLYKDRRLVAIFIETGGLASDDQLKLRQYAINFVNDGLKPADLVCVMMADGGAVRVAQDFTDNKALLQTAIQNLSLGSGAVDASDMNARLSDIETASKMLAGFPEKKALIYFSSGIAQTGTDNQTRLLELINVAKKSNVAIYPVDARSTVGPAIGAAGGSGGGRSMTVPAAPAGVSQEEYDRRVAYAQSKFWSTTSAMSRSYIRYGEPDQIENRGAGVQIWRYNYLDDFHGGAALEFTGKGPMDARIIWPAPQATYEGQFIPGRIAQLGPLLNQLLSGAVNNGAGFPGSFPAGHASIQVRTISPGMAPSDDRRFPALIVPLDSLSGTVDIAASVQYREAIVTPQEGGGFHGTTGQVVANVRYSAQASTGTWQADFTVPPGAYVCNVVMREKATGRIFTESIDFDAK
jgi:beta-lactamase regulating signal transducer with metallopeptidase domain